MYLKYIRIYIFLGILAVPNIYAENQYAQTLYEDAVSILSKKDVKLYEKAFEFLDEARELNHVLASGLSAAIDNTCLYIDPDLNYCKYSKKHIQSMVPNAMYRLKSYQQNGELCLIVGLSDSGLFIEDILIVDIDVKDWIMGDKEEQYIEASKWMEMPSRPDKNHRYLTGINLTTAINDLKVARQFGNEYANKYLDLIIEKYPLPKVRDLIASKEPVFSKCLQ